MSRENQSGLGTDFWKRRLLIGMVHLGALPGSPQDLGMGMEPVLEAAVRDAKALEEGGADALMVENFFDAPFSKADVPPHTIAAMALAVQEVKRVVNIPIGVNILRNDALGAIAVAHICGAHFVRVNVWVGAAVTDQGVIEGAARRAILYRRELGANVQIWADVFVKHAVQLGGGSLEDAARDAVMRGMADALIVSGMATGLPTRPEEVRRVREAVPDTPVLIGSGFDAQTASTLLKYANGAIVGTSLKREGAVAHPVESARVRALRGIIDTTERT